MATHKQSTTQSRQQKCYLTPQNRIKLLAYVSDESEGAVKEKRSLNKTINKALKSFLKSAE